jgi:hypothetical protein
MRKKLCFSSKDPWVLGHKCMGKGEIHYIEVAAESVDSEEEQNCGSTSSEEEPSQAEEQPPRRPPTPGGTHPPVAPHPPEQANVRKPSKGRVKETLYGVPRYDTLWIRGTIQGQRQSPLLMVGPPTTSLMLHWYRGEHFRQRSLRDSMLQKQMAIQ